jgi:hypothetical protein
MSFHQEDYVGRQQVQGISRIVGRHLDSNSALAVTAGPVAERRQA